MTVRSTARIVGHVARVVLGLVFLVAGLLKTIDPAEFTRQMADYQIIGERLPAALAPLLIAFEIALGVALLAGFRLRASALSAAGLLVAFMGIEAYGISIGKTESCGCFGAYVQRTPGQVIVEDLVLLAMAMLAWRLLRPWEARRHGRAAAVVVAAGMLSLGFTMASPRLPLDRWVTRLSPGRPIADLGIASRAPELAQGRYLVALIDLTDPGAGETAERLNELVEQQGVPPVVVLTPSTEEDKAAFIWSAVPAFDIHVVDRPVLKRLYRELPRFFLVDSGHVEAIFDGSGPPAAGLLLSGAS